MYKLSAEQVQIIMDALNMALQSNKRMQTAKPKFSAVFQAIENDINIVKDALLKPVK